MIQTEAYSKNRITKSDTELFAIPKSGEYNFKNVSFADSRVWNLFARGDTLGCFQLETQLGQDWSKRVKPRNIEELAALVSLLRPGPLESGFSDEYVKCKSGEEDLFYLHPKLEPILKDTYSCLIYQEQCAKIAVELAGFTPVQSDNLRKAIGKKKPEEMAKVKKMFLEGAEKGGLINKSEAEEIFGWIEKSVRYSFNKSHAVSYAIISYLSAYQKVHFPTEFYCSWLTYSDWKADPKEEVYNLVQNARLNNISVLPPCIKKSNTDFEIMKDKEIIFGLGHIRGVGSKAIESIKSSSGSLDNFIDFIVSVKTLKRNIAEALIKSGSCDCYNLSRSYMLKCIHTIYGRQEKDKTQTLPEVRELTAKEFKHFIDVLQKTKDIVESLEAVMFDGKCVKTRIPTIQSKIEYIKTYVNDTNRQKSIWEKIYLGLNLTCSAADDISKIEENTTTCRDVYKLAPGSKAIMHVVIDDIKMRKTSEKSRNPGQDFCFLRVSDNTGALSNITCWPETYEKIKDILSPDIVATIYAKKQSWNNKDQIVVEDIVPVG